MTLAILDQQFELLRCLDTSPKAQIYLASDFRGVRWIVKLILDPDNFFDELARHYALDQVEGVCRLQRNYPPFLASGNPVLFEADFLRLLNEDIDRDGEGRMKNDAMLASPLAGMGILVLEYVPGVPLRDVLVELDRPDQIAHLLALTEVVGELHSRGEYHGDLRPDNVMMDTTNGDVKLVGIGTGSSSQGEPDEPPGWEGDVHTLASLYMSEIDAPSSKLRTLMADCMHKDLSRRPAVPEIIGKLIGEKGVPARNSSLLVVSAVAALLLMGFLFLYRSRPHEPFQYSKARGSQPYASALRGKTFLDPQLGPFCDYLSEAIKIRIVYPPHLKYLELPSGTLESDDWQAVLKRMGLGWLKKEENGEPVIEILVPKS